MVTMSTARNSNPKSICLPLLYESRDLRPSTFSQRSVTAVRHRLSGIGGRNSQGSSIPRRDRDIWSLEATPTQRGQAPITVRR